jgi:RNA polymerase sigma factor (TIGR02999 family)
MATELAHEAYERLLSQQAVDWQNGEHFMAIAATVIRRVLIDYLRERSAQKRGSGMAAVPLHDLLDSEHPSSGDHVDWLVLDQALPEFARVEPVTARVVELRLFGCMSIEEIATVCGSSTATVGRQWRFARAWTATSLALPAP